MWPQSNPVTQGEADPKAQVSSEPRSVKTKGSKATDEAQSLLVDGRKIPEFDGDSERWNEDMEKYFEAEKIDSRFKVAIGTSHMDGSAFNLSKFIRRVNPEISWEDFYSFFSKRYSKDSEISKNYFYRESFKDSLVLSQLSSIQQTGSVDEYIDKFLSLAMLISVLHPKIYLSLFLKGLKNEVRDGMLPDERTNVMDAIVASQVVYSRLVKEKEDECKKIVEVEEEKEEECKKLVEVEEENEEECKKLVEVEEEKSAKSAEREQEEAKRSAEDEAAKKTTVTRFMGKGIAGDIPKEVKTAPWISKVNLSVNGRPPTSSIINGVMGNRLLNVVASPTPCHNMISIEAVRKFELPVQPTAEFGVQVDGGEAVKSQGLVKNLKLTLWREPMVLSFYVFPLPAWVDAVVGVIVKSL